ncbi:MAG: hypothetical protein ACREL1_08660, partial [bacterium]
LGLILNELRKSKKLKNLGVDTNRPGRGAIKGKKETAVWDCLRFKEAGKTDNFTKHPHLTVVIHPERLQVLATLPNAAEGAIRKRIFGQGYEYFHRLVFQVAQSMKKVIKLDPAAKPYIQVLQRHYRSLNSPGIEDAVLKYDIRTILNKGGNKEKFQPQWIHATYDVMIKKKSNLQFEFGVDFPFSTSRTANNSKTINAIEESFFAMKSFILIAFHKERR